MMKDKFKDYGVVALSALFLAIAFNTTSLPLEIVIGGSSGLSIIFEHFFNIPPAVVVFCCYVGALVCGYIFLGKEKIKKSIFGSLMYPLFVFLTSPLCDYVKSFEFSSSDYLMLVIIGAVVSGVAYGLVYKRGRTTGGSDIASQILNKYTGITVGTSNLIINATIVIAGGAIFGWDKVLYAILTLYVIGIATDRVLLGMSYSKFFYIITDKVDEVKEYVCKEFSKSVTELDAVGGYTNNGNKVLLYVVTTRDYFKLKEGINIIDKDAFFVIMDAYELESRT